MILSLEPTNACNLRCLHCIRDKLEDRGHIPLDVLQKILREAKSYGLNYIAITGGEPTLHPRFDEMLEMVAGEGFKFHVVTNGFQFKSKVLPILSRPHVKKHLKHISISLDGATAKIHDANRGAGAFKVIMEMLGLCKLKDIPFNLITVINNINKAELTDIALFGSGMGATAHMFGPLTVTPLAVQTGIIPSPNETRRWMSFVDRNLSRALKMPITIGSGGYCSAPLFSCRAFGGDHLNVDFQGNAIFCCTLSHPADDSKPNEQGKEVIADLKRESLGTAIVRQREMSARLIQERLREIERGTLLELDYFPCYWCLKQFGKLGWLDSYPDSPWSEGLSKEKLENSADRVRPGVG